MATNFDFLKKVDTNLFEIISEAEKLYRDEYFEQCMGQTRRFGENVCKKVLGANRTTEKTFDDMLATLKDCSTGEDVEKEFIDDLYFLKKHGNNAVHSSSVKKDGMEALECLQRAFEVAINYSVYNRSASSNILKLRYDTELLVTGKKKEKSLAEKYTEAKKQTTKKTTTKPKAKKNTTNKKKFQKQSSVMVCKTPKKRISIYWIFVGISCIISLTIVLGMIIALHVK
ncbi:type II restriction-modification system restriction subunit [Clostridium sp. CAG:768]|nr:type II restriction-modification system restriction subunit [Clostridium sp. CAG:768]